MKTVYDVRLTKVSKAMLDFIGIGYQYSEEDLTLIINDDYEYNEIVNDYPKCYEYGYINGFKGYDSVMDFYNANERIIMDALTQLAKDSNMSVAKFVNTYSSIKESGYSVAAISATLDEDEDKLERLERRGMEIPRFEYVAHAIILLFVVELGNQVNNGTLVEEEDEDEDEDVFDDRHEEVYLGDNEVDGIVDDIINPL